MVLKLQYFLQRYRLHLSKKIVTLLIYLHWFDKIKAVEDSSLVGCYAMLTWCNIPQESEGSYSGTSDGAYDGSDYFRVFYDQQKLNTALPFC